MKNLFALLLFTLLSVYNVTSQRRTDAEWEGLKGRVKSVRFERAEVLQGDITSSGAVRVLESVTTYNERGDRIEELKYHPDGSLFEKRSFARDEEGNQISTIYKPDGTIDSKWVYKFDGQERRTLSAWHNPDGSLRLKIQATYDASGKLLEEAMYNPDDTLRYKTLFSYDAEGRRVGSTSYNGNGTLASKSAWSKADGKIVLYNSDKTIRYEEISRPPSLDYDSQGNWIKLSKAKTVTRDHKPVEVLEVIYRTLTYY